METININGKDFTIEELSKLIENFKYPIYCLHLPTNKIVKFTGLSEGVVVKSGFDQKRCPMGTESQYFPEHTNKDIWRPLPVYPKTSFSHGQLVWAWCNNYTHFRVTAFYDAENSRLFSIDGKKDSLAYHNYLPFEGAWPDWALEAHKTLKL